MATRGYEHVTAAQAATMGRRRVRMPAVKTSGRSKYHAIKTVVDGVTFDSQAEARRYSELKLLQQSGAICHLLLQPIYRIFAHPVGKDAVPIAKYVGDFQYETVNGLTVVEDVKGFKTPVYRLKKKLVEAAYGIQIREIH